MKVREFMNGVQMILEKQSKEELGKTLLGIARNVPSGERAAFLKRLEPGEQKRTPFNAVLKALRKLQKKAESGVLSEGWGWDSDYGEEREWGDESWSTDVDFFLQQALGFYSEGCFENALTLYREIFGILELGEETGHLPDPPDPLSLLTEDVDEALLVMIRLKYITAPVSKRVELMFSEASDNYHLCRYKGFIDGIMGVDTKPLPGIDDFIGDWISYLSPLQSELADVLLREVVRISGGIEAVEKYAVEKGASNPGFWKDLFSMLQDSDKWDRIIALSGNALASINPDYIIRSEVSDFVVKAANESGNDALQLQALREGFYSCTKLNRLIDLAIDSDQQDVFPEEMERACNRVIELNGTREYTGWRNVTAMGMQTFASSDIVAWSLFYSCRFDEAVQICLEDGPVGWSGQPSGIVVPLFLCMLRGKASAALLQLLELSISFSSDLDSGKIKESLQPLLRNGLPAEKRKTIFSWCRERVEKRVTEIVKMKYRKSYRKAAILAVTIAELINSSEGEATALDYLLGWRTTFNRHTAFRSELQGCTAASALPSAREISRKM